MDRPVPESPPRRIRAPGFSREIALVVLIALTVIVFSILFPVSFFALENLRAILRNMAVDGILAIGMMLLLVAGSFDLSVGSMLSLSGVVAGWLMKDAGWPVPLAALAGLAVAAAGGLLNGLIVAKVRVNALLATLGSMGVFQGLAVLIGGPGITFLPRSFSAIGQTEIAGLQTPVWLMLFLAIGAHYLLSRTRFFRQLYYVGSNPEAARLSGIRVERVQIFAFVTMGCLAGLAGIAFASRVGTAVSSAGVGAELRVIAAVILGGASLQGGKGTIPGAMAGVVFMALVNNVLIITRISSYWHGIILGVVLVLAVAIDSVMNRREG